MKFGNKKTRALRYGTVKNGVYISLGLESVPGRVRHTDGRTDRITISSTRLALGAYVLSRVKIISTIISLKIGLDHANAMRGLHMFML